MLQSFFSTETFLRLTNKLLYQILGLLTNLVPFFAVEVKLTFLHHLENLLIVITIKWRIATEKNVQYAASRPEVALNTVVSCKYFWRDIVWRTCSCAHSINIFWVYFIRTLKWAWTKLIAFYYLWQAKIDDLEVRTTLSFEQEVFRLQVSMCDSLMMTVIEALEYLLKQPRCILFWEAFFFNDLVEEFSTFT